MSWSEFHERTAFIAELIERAEVDAVAALDFDEVQRAEMQRLFGDEHRLLLALRHKWVNTLTVKLEQAVHDDVPAEQARAQLAAAQPGLRALLDLASQRSVQVRGFERAEQQIVDCYRGPEVVRVTVA